MTKLEVAEKIYQGLNRQKFFDWYNSDFQNHLSREDLDHLKTKSEILDDIVTLFVLKTN